MNQGKYVFKQLMSFVSRYEFNKCVARYGGNRRVRHLGCWQQFLSLAFGQLTHRESLRDIVICLKAQENKLYHLGFKQPVARSTLSDANQQRDWRIYADFAQVLIKEAIALYAAHEDDTRLFSQPVYALDSSLIRLCLNIFFWAKYRKGTAAIKIHALLNVETAIPHFIHITDGLTHDVNILKALDFEPGAFYVMDRAYVDFEQLFRLHQAQAFFVLRAKKNLQFKRQYSRSKSDQEGIQADQIGVLTGFYAQKHYPEKLRRIKAKDPDSGSVIVILTNHMSLEAQQIALIYRNRWQIELFFKWIKQHLRIKSLWGQSENAVMIHIYSALCTYLIVAIVRKRLNIQQSLYEILQILSVSPFDKTPLNQLFTNQKLQNEKNDIHKQLSIWDL